MTAYSNKERLTAIFCAVMTIFLVMIPVIPKAKAAEEGMTRLEAVVFIMDSVGYDIDEGCSADNPFDDVPQWAESYVGCAYIKGIVNGTAEKTFGCDVCVTREEFLTMVLRLLNYDDRNDLMFSWNDPYERAELSGIYDADSFKGNFTREEAKKIMAKAFFASSYLSYNRFCDTFTPGEEIAAEVDEEAENRSLYADSLSRVSAAMGKIHYRQELPEYSILFGYMLTPHGISAVGYVIYKRDGTVAKLSLPYESVWTRAMPDKIWLNDEKTILNYSAVCKEDITFDGRIMQQSGTYEYSFDLQ